MLVDPLPDTDALPETELLPLAEPEDPIDPDADELPDCEPDTDVLPDVDVLPDADMLVEELEDEELPGSAPANGLEIIRQGILLPVMITRLLFRTDVQDAKMNKRDGPPMRQYRSR